MNLHDFATVMLSGLLLVLIVVFVILLIWNLVYFRREIFGIAMFVVQEYFDCCFSRAENGLHSQTENWFKGISGDVLDFGAGNGALLTMLVKNDKITSYKACEINEMSIKLLKYRLKKYKKKIKFDCEVAGDLRKIGKEKIDTIVVRHVFCSIENKHFESILKDMHYILKKNGRIVLMEHVAHRKTGFGLLLQKLWLPFNMFVADCDCAKDTETQFQRFSHLFQITSEYKKLKLFPLFSPHIFVVLKKK